jgi:phosphoribosylglycinamide formyltransferase 1
MRTLIQSGEINAKLSFVFINREVKGNQFRAKLISMAEQDGVPVIIIPSDGFRSDLKTEDMNAWRMAYGQAMRTAISKHPMDFGVLAGYMLILDQETCAKHSIINLHPALPGTYQGTWEDIVRRVAESDDDSYGSMVHLCTPELDRGDTVTYDRFEISDLRREHASKEELAKAIRAREVQREVPLLMETVKLLVNGDVVIRDGRLFDRNGRELAEAPCIASIIDGRLN